MTYCSSPGLLAAFAKGDLTSLTLLQYASLNSPTPLKIKEDVQYCKTPRVRSGTTEQSQLTANMNTSFFFLLLLSYTFMCLSRTSFHDRNGHFPKQYDSQNSFFCTVAFGSTFLPFIRFSLSLLHYCSPSVFKLTFYFTSSATLFPAK